MYDTAVKQTKRPYNLPTYFIARPSKIYQNWYICLKINHLATLATMRCMHFRKKVASCHRHRQLSLSKVVLPKPQQQVAPTVTGLQGCQIILGTTYQKR
jgi:hypothetical protein